MPTPRSPPKRRWPGESSEGFPRPRCPLSRRSPRFFPLSFTVSSLVEPVFSRLSPTPRLAAASQLPLPLPLPTVAVFCTFLAACASHARSSHCRQSYPAEPILGISRQALTPSRHSRPSQLVDWTLAEATPRRRTRSRPHTQHTPEAGRPPSPSPAAAPSCATHAIKEERDKIRLAPETTTATSLRPLHPPTVRTYPSSWGRSPLLHRQTH